MHVYNFEMLDFLVLVVVLTDGSKAVDPIDSGRQ